MNRKRYTNETIVALLRQAEVELTQGKRVDEICRSLGISSQSYCRWRSEYGGLKLEQARRMKAPRAIALCENFAGTVDFLAGRWGEEPLSRKTLSNALRGRKVIRKGKPVVHTPGLCAQLGIKPFTPHDLRRTAASLMGSIGISRATISLCLDHSIVKCE